MGSLESYLREDCSTGKHSWNWFVQNKSYWTKEVDGTDLLLGIEIEHYIQTGDLECNKCLTIKQIKRYKNNGKIRCKYSSAIWEDYLMV